MSTGRRRWQVTIGSGAAIPLLAVLLCPPLVASITPGSFTPGAPWFLSPLGFGVDKPTSPSDKVRVDTDGDGLPDTDFDLPAELVPAAGIDFEYRLSPSQGFLYVTKFNPQPSGMSTVCGGFPKVEVHLYALDAPPTLTPFAVVGGGGSSCMTPEPAKVPAFYDQSGSVRTMVLVGAEGSAGIGGFQMLWADLIGRQMTIDTSTYLNGLAQVAIEFSPSGNAAFVVHGFSTIQEKYTFVDLCDDPLGGTTTTQDLPGGGAPSARVISSGSDFLAELLLGGVPQLGSQVLLSTACCPTGTAACCQAGLGCTDDVSPDDCVAAGGVALAGACSAVDCEEACCLEGACSVMPRSECLGADGMPSGTFSCSGVFCPPPLQACCTLYGTCLDVPAADCGPLYGGAPQGPGTACYTPTTLVCPVLHLLVNKNAPAQVVEGVPFDYTIDYENDGDLLAPATVLRDFPSSDFVAASHGGVFNAGQVEWTLGDLDVGQSGQVTLTVRPACGSPGVDNTAYAESSGLQFWSNTPFTQVLPDTAPIDLQVQAIGASGLPLEGGHLVTLTFTLTNTAASPRFGVGFNIDLKPGMALQSVIDAAGGQVAMNSPQSWRWTGDLGPMAMVQVIVTAQVNLCVQQTEVGLRTVVVTSDCNRELGRAPHVELPVRRPLEVQLRALNLHPPVLLENRTSSQVFQLLRHGDTLDLQLSVTNPHATPVASANLFAFVPAGYDPVGDPPFIAPTQAGAVWNAALRRVSWSGSIPAQGMVTITYRVQHQGDSFGVTLSGNASNGSCTIFSNHTLTPVPFPPTEPHLLVLKLGQLMTFRPGIDPQPQPLFAFPNDFLNNERIARKPNGDIWVAGPPIFRFNPETLALEGLPLDFVDDLEFLPWDVGVEPNSGRVIFIGNKLQPDGAVLGLRIREYDPLAKTLFGRYDSPEEDPLYLVLNIRELMVVDPWGGVGFVHDGRYVYRHNGGDPDLLTPNRSPSVAGVAPDVDGSYLLIGQGFGPDRLEDLSPSGGDPDILLDLHAEFGQLFSPQAMAAGDGGDIYISSGHDGLVVFHRAGGTSDVILPEGPGTSPMLDILWVSDACDDGDGDGAGVGVGCAPSEIDCDDENPDTFPGAVERNDGLDNQCLGDRGGGIVDELPPTAYFDGPGDSSDLHWDAQQDATEYQVVRSPLPDFSSGCTSVITTDVHWVDTAVPALDEIWYYLVRPFSPFAGSFGFDSAGIERAIACP